MTADQGVRMLNPALKEVSAILSLSIASRQTVQEGGSTSLFRFTRSAHPQPEARCR